MSQSLAETMTDTDPIELIASAMSSAIVRVLGDEFADADPLITHSQRPELGDFQSNAAMSLAKRVGRKPRELAEELASAVTSDLEHIVEPPDVAGPGFLNFRLKPAALSLMLDAIDTPALGIVPDADPYSIVIDLCGVNVSKQMHVGHLRATIIGDALARVYERLGRTVHRENHLGDWGLPIAMVLHHLRESGKDIASLTLDDLDVAYRTAQLGCKSDVPGLAAAKQYHAGPHRMLELEAQNETAERAMEASKQTLVRLQQGDSEVHGDWQELIDVTMRAVFDVLGMLNVRIGPENNRGESFYRDRLADVIDAFVRDDLAQEDEGALVVHFEDRERPLLIRKSDGGYLYATTDLAAVRYRAQELDGGRIIYVVDARQRDHFRDVFDAVRLIGWDRKPDGTHAELVHLPFGAVLGKDKRPFKTRSGDTVTLRSLLEEAIERGTSEVRSRAADPNAPTHGLSDAELVDIGRAVGIGAIKYADLSNDVVRDYVFDMDRMIAFEGNTGPYLQYAHARICSIFSKGGVDPESCADVPLVIDQPEEKALALMLLRYGKVVAEVARELEPHRLCTYLYDLANAYSSFYQQCPVLKVDDEATKRSRLRLCAITRHILADGLHLLGIEAPQRM